MTRNYILCPNCFDLAASKRGDGETCFDVGFTDGLCGKCKNGIIHYVKCNPPDAPQHKYDPHHEAELFNSRKKSK